MDRLLKQTERLGVGLLLALMLLQMTLLARANSCTWDEADHTYAGYMQWTHEDFGLNPEHPPLVKFLATAPLLGMRLRMPPLADRVYRMQEVNGDGSLCLPTMRMRSCFGRGWLLPC